MVRTRRITRGGPDAAIFLANEILIREMLVLSVAPFVTSALVEVFGEGFGDPVCQRFDHDRIVIVMILLELLAKLLHAETRAHGKAPNVIPEGCLLRRDE